MDYVHTQRCQTKKNIVRFHLYKSRKCKQTYGDNVDFWLPREGPEEGVTSWYKETFGRGGYGPYLDCGNDFIGLFICQNLSD